jgi:hypothetical protein
MLSGDEFSLLTKYFRLVVPPVLIDEIVADLELKPTERRLPDVVVKRLAERMRKALGYEPVDYVQAVAGNLLGAAIPMFGQVPIGSRPNAYRTALGKDSSTTGSPSRSSGSVSLLGFSKLRMQFARESGARRSRRSTFRSCIAR